MMNGIQFQSVQTPNALSSELRSVIRCSAILCAGQRNGCAGRRNNRLYERLSQEDKLDGESNSIANQKKILERYPRICHRRSVESHRSAPSDFGNQLDC